MRERSWDDCLSSFSARKVSKDISRARSLVETASERISLISEINSKNCNFVFEDYYTSIIEVLQANAFRNGFNILNHICLGYYLRDCLGREDLFNVFDDLRYKRNSLTYYGNRMEFETAKLAIKKCKVVLRELKKQK